MNYLLLSLFISTIVLIYAILDYYGYIRFCKLNTYSPDTYVDNYKKLKKNIKNKVVVSIATNKKDLRKLHPTISSLLDQTVKVDMIALTLPYSKTKIPKSLKRCVVEYRTGKDYGNGDCLIPVILREGDANTIVITVADDVVYGKDFIENLLRVSKDNPDCIVFCGEQLNVKKGALFKMNMFDPEIVNKQGNTDCNKWIMKNMGNVKKVKLNYSGNI